MHSNLTLSYLFLIKVIYINYITIITIINKLFKRLKVRMKILYIPIVSISSLSSPLFFSLVSFFGEGGFSLSFLPPFFPPFPGDWDLALDGLVALSKQAGV